ncbi:unnamed protein product [Cylicocyclus nassatus]|uniref:Uncharacterized protein n=1 Tax=Cylicocyclus nassatus TaxID=53992 RepID=A0AA36GKM4_CYLNA|nr:unnamed protein product [Cylicocyclus nassatus]
MDRAKATPVLNGDVRALNVDDWKGTLKPRTPATAFPELSVSMTKGRPNLGATRMGAVVSANFRHFMEFSHSGVHIKGASFLVKAVRGEAIAAKLCTNLLKKEHIPKKALTSVGLLGVG